jgi:hypothetical protein
MRTIPLGTLLAIFISCSVTAQPDWSWASTTDTPNEIYLTDICNDRSGNLYLTGYMYDDTISFQNMSLINTVNVIKSFVAKFNSNGTLVWLKSPQPGPGYLVTAGIGVDNHNNIYYCGSHNMDSVQFGNITIPNTSSNNYNFFIAKMDSTLVYQKVATSSGGGANIIDRMYIANDGRAIISGSNGVAMTFGSVLFNSYNYFLISTDTLLNGQWGKKMPGKVTSIEMDINGYIYAAVYSALDTIVFAGNTYYNYAPGNFTNDIYILKFDQLGNEIACMHAGGKKDDYVYDLAIDHHGNLHLAGEFFSDPLYLGSDSMLNSATIYLKSDAFIIKADPAFNPAYMKNFGWLGHDEQCRTVACDSAGNTFIAGEFSGPYIIFYGDTLLNPQNFKKNIFFAKFDQNGNYIWSNSAGLKRDDGITEIITDEQSSYLYAGGSFQDSMIQFGSITVSCTSSPYLENIFIGKIDLATGLSEYSKGSGKESIVFPNPCSHNFFITLKDQNNTERTLTIYDLNGRVLQSEQIPKNYGEENYNISTGTLCSGTYIIQMKAEKTITYSKLVVVK